MLHEELEKTKDQGYPAIKKILSDCYGEQVSGVEQAEIKAVDLGARSFGFFVNLPEASQAVEKKLFLKIEVPLHATRSAELEAKESEMQRTTFSFMEAAHGEFAIPKVLRDQNGNFTPNISAPEGGIVLPQLDGHKLTLMTQVEGKAVPFSQGGKKALQEFVARKPNGNTGNLLRDDVNYTSYDISQMVATIAEMHKFGQKFLAKNEVPVNPTQDFRPYQTVYGDLNNVFGCDVVKLPEEQISQKVAETKVMLKQKVRETLKEVFGVDAEDGAEKGIVSRMKDSFVPSLPKKFAEIYQQGAPFNHVLDESIRSGEITQNQMIAGRQILQISEVLDFADDAKLTQTVRMAKEVAKVYEGVVALPQTILHNDTNPTNFLRDEKTGKMTLIDFDTLGTGPRMADVMLWHAGRDQGGKDRPHVTAAGIAAYDDKMRITSEEEKFAPYITACGTFDKFAKSLKIFSELEKINDVDHLTSLNNGVNAAFDNAANWNKMAKVDLTATLEKSRAQTLSALDLVGYDDQKVAKETNAKSVEHLDLADGKRSWADKVRNERQEREMMGKEDKPNKTNARGGR